MARKNIHGKQGVRFKAGWTKAKNEAMLRNLVTDLVIHGKVETTSLTARQLVALADRLITIAKKSLVEPEKNSVRAHRHAARIVRDRVINEKTGETVLQRLFDHLVIGFKDREGGYTRRIKIGERQGDNALVVKVEWVD